MELASAASFHPPRFGETGVRLAIFTSQGSSAAQSDTTAIQSPIFVYFGFVKWFVLLYNTPSGKISKSRQRGSSEKPRVSTSEVLPLSSATFGPCNMNQLKLLQGGSVRCRKQIHLLGKVILLCVRMKST